jgi:hypothetical protein
MPTVSASRRPNPGRGLIWAVFRDDQRVTDWTDELTAHRWAKRERGHVRRHRRGGDTATTADQPAPR